MPLARWISGHELPPQVREMRDDTSFLDAVGIDRRRLLKLHGAHALGLRDFGHRFWALLVLWVWRRLCVLARPATGACVQP